MTEYLHMTASDAEAAFHIFTAICYGLPLFGAWLADNVFGKYAVIMYLSGFYCLGENLNLRKICLHNFACLIISCTDNK